MLVLKRLFYACTPCLNISVLLSHHNMLINTIAMLSLTTSSHATRRWLVASNWPADEFQPTDEVLRVSVLPSGTWKCPRMSRDLGHLASAAGCLHSRVVSSTTVDAFCSAHSPLPTRTVSCLDSIRSEHCFISSATRIGLQHYHFGLMMSCLSGA